MFKMQFDMTDTPVVTVQTTEGRGFTPDEVAERCVAKMISVADTAHPAFRDQAKPYNMNMEKVVAFYMREAIRIDRTTVYTALVDAVLPDSPDAIRRL